MKIEKKKEVRASPSIKSGFLFNDIDKYMPLLAVFLRFYFLLLVVMQKGLCLWGHF